MLLLAVRSMTIKPLHKLVLVVAKFEKSIDSHTNAIYTKEEPTNITDEVLDPVYIPQVYHCIFTHLQGHPHKSKLVLTVSPNVRQHTDIFDLVETLDDIQAFDTFY